MRSLGHLSERNELRQSEVVSDALDDFSAAVVFLTTLDYVDGERIDVLDVCVSGGHAISTVQQEECFKAVAAVSMFIMRRVRRQERCG
ncbi:hypothetical protein [Streptomyces mirabilis]|uniref:hypothetical protein n=1 Tax=Streptomyces mirabilis TaxID=68239 RepID=UPI00332182F2